MPKRVLHKQDASPPSCAVMMTAHVLNLDLEYKEPAILEGELKSTEYRQINPMATIPTVQDGNFTVSESHAIIKYLVEKYGGDQRSALYPFDVEVRAIIDERMFFDAGFFFSRLRAVTVPTVRQGLTAPTQAQLDDIEDAYSTLELYLHKSRYIAADHLTIADLSVGSTAFAIQAILPVDSAKFPKTSEWMQNLEKVSCFQEIGASCAAKFKGFVNMFWEMNKSKQ